MTDELIARGGIACREPRSVSHDEFGTLDLDGDWEYRVGALRRTVTFELEGDEIVLRGPIGEYRGGLAAHAAHVITLVEHLRGPGPHITTWLNLVRTAPGQLEGTIQALGGDEDDPVPVNLTRQA